MERRAISGFEELVSRMTITTSSATKQVYLWLGQDCPYHANFLIKSVSDLWQNLHSSNSNMVVFIVKPEKVLVEANVVWADVVFARKEVLMS
ncbi:hypothetical protein VNO78_15564 [Psophocarpus tetragonolobus]|uniref:Uncharacterized protein n=1 Tax=Psophocarpus tetragonolobus TaxID=3891 RepID=A0AAN9XK11_PSOTE